MNLKSSIKAYCLELMNNKLEETSTSGGAGGYLTKKAFRKPKPQDKNSLTGFESSPKPNMYTKTMKFKIVDPKDRLNSKDLWKGEHLEEIKINNPNNQELKDAISNLKDQGELFLEDNIVIRRYNDLIEEDGEFGIYDFNKPGDDYTTEPEFESNDVNKILNWLQQNKKSLQIKNTLSESRYTQFKKSTSKPKPREILHRAIKEIQLKLDEVNRLIEFTTRIKGELQENDQEIEYLKRTKDSLYKIQNKLKEAFQNISKIN